MADAKLRQSIAFEAARLMYDRIESEYYTAKWKAAKRLNRGKVKPSDLPSNAEIRELIQHFARMHEGDSRTENLKEMRFLALGMMRLLCRYRPRLIGSVMTGHVRKGSDIDLHIFSDSAEAIASILESEGYQYDVERKLITKHNESRVFTHIHVFEKFNFELTVYAENLAHFVFKSSITGKAIERASIVELEQLLKREYPENEIDQTLEDQNEAIDPYLMYKLMLVPLEKVKQNPIWHPEGDVLFHSLQVFEHARNAMPYDEEFIAAALLHDVGKGIDKQDHVNAGLQALEGLITDRTAWLIENHMLAMQYKSGELGARQRKHLESHEEFETLMLLRECDDAGRNPTARVGTVDLALEFLRDLERQNNS